MNIGTLTGAIALEDQLSGQLTVITSRVKQFASSFDGLIGSTAISVGVLTAAVAGAAVSILNLGEKGSVIQGVEDSFNRLAVQAGSTGEALIGGLSAGVRDTIDSMVLMQSTTRLLSSGVKLSADDMRVLGATAREMGKATGTDAAQGLNTLSSALLTGQTRALKRFGINIDLIQSEKDFAKSLGTTRDQLNEAGKLEARRIAMLEAMRTKLDVLGTSELNFKERIQQAQVAVGNWFDSLAKGVANSPSVTRAFVAIQDAIVATFGGDSEKLLRTIIGWVNSFADSVARIGPTVISTIGSIRDRIVSIWNAIVDFNDRWQITNTVIAGARTAWSLLEKAFDLVKAAVVAVIHAWESMPEWLQRITRTGLEAAAALSIYSVVIGAAASPLSNLVNSIDLGINIIGNATGAIFNLSHMTNVWTMATGLATKATGLLTTAKIWLTGATLGLSIQFNVLMASLGLTTTGLAVTTTAANAASVAFTALGVAIKFVLLPLAALWVGFKAGTWLEQNTKWARELSDSFQYAALRVQGYSAAQADAMIASNHATEAAIRQKSAVDSLAKSQAEASAAEERRRRERLTGQDTATAVHQLRTDFLALSKAQQESTITMDRVGEAASRLRAQGGRLHPELKALADRFDEAQKKSFGLGEGFIKLDKEMTPAQKALADVNTKIKQLQAGSSVLSDANKASIVSFTELGLSADEIAIKIGQSTVAVAAYLAERKKADDAAKASAANLERNAAFEHELAEQALRDAERRRARELETDAAITASRASLNAVAADYAQKNKERLLTGTALEIERLGVVKAKAIADLGERTEANAAYWDAAKAQIDKYFKGEEEKLKKSKSAWEKTYSSLGNVATILDSISGKLAEVGAMAARAAQAVMKNLAEGDWIGAIVSGVTAVIGIFGKLFGGLTDYQKRVRAEAAQAQEWRIETDKLRSSFILAAGGMLELQQRAFTAGVTLKDVLDAKTPDEYKAAVDRLNDALKFQDDAMKLLDDTAKKYGLTLSEMGPRYRQGKLDEEFRILFQDQEVLKAGGVDYDLILRKQVDSYKSLIQVALDTGATIPLAMKPAIMRMDELGLFVDEAGKSMIDVTRLNFAETLDAKFETLIETVLRLAEAIERGLSGAIANIPTPRAPWADWGPMPGPRNGPFAFDEPEYRSVGGVIPFRPRGTDTVPAMLTPGERVLTVAQNKEYESGPNRPIIIDNTINLDGQKVARNQVKHLPAAYKRAGG